jgi:hypothetical protein
MLSTSFEIKNLRKARRKMRKNISIIIVIAAVGLVLLWLNHTANNKIAVLEGEIATLHTAQQAHLDSIDSLLDENQILKSSNEALNNALMSIRYSMAKDALPQYWQSTWTNICKHEGALDMDMIDEINFLLQPYFTYENWDQVNPLSAFFTSYYEHVAEINFDDFLRYFPYGEVPDELPEFEALSKVTNWPFQTIDFDNIPVPIHRYNREVVQSIFTIYANVRLEDLRCLL